MTNNEIIKLLNDYNASLVGLHSQRESTYLNSRSFINKNRVLVQRILKKAGKLRTLDITPPPAIGGYILKKVNPLDLIFDPPYGLDINSFLYDIIEQTIGVVESDPNFYLSLQYDKQDAKENDVWQLVHPSIVEVSKNRMKDGYYADAVEAACKTLNARVRAIVLDQTGEESDGAKLMRKAFSPQNPVVCIADLSNQSGHDTQQGYMDIYAGVMTGIRNPKAHDNDSISKDDALRKLILISLLMYKIDGRITIER